MLFIRFYDAVNKQTLLRMEQKIEGNNSQMHDKINGLIRDYFSSWNTQIPAIKAKTDRLP